MPVEEGHRSLVHAGRTVTVPFALFLPPQTPTAAILLLHGFGGTRWHHRNLAERCSANGVAVLTPDMVSLLPGDGARDTNVLLAVQHMQWLSARFGVELGIGGHSAGGGIAIEAQVACAESGIKISALLLLDAVGSSDGGGRPGPEPPTRTMRVAAQRCPPPTLSLRAEPGGWNAYGNILHLLRVWRALQPSICDVKLVGASHIDPVGPMPWVARAFLGWHAEAHELFIRLSVEFLLAAIAKPDAGLHFDTTALTSELVRAGRVVCDL
jgi:pimeloyl-ACP methyl ester carboxylesterase